jgi:hypothetical protein
MPSNRYDHLSPLPAGFQMLQNSSQLIVILPSGAKLLDIQEDDQAASSDLNAASHTAFSTIWLRVADIFTPFSHDTPSTTGYHPHHATHHRSPPHPASKCRATQGHEAGSRSPPPIDTDTAKPRSTSGNDKETLRKAMFAHGVLVIRNQAGLDPTVLVTLAKLFDPAPLDHHSGGAKQVTDPNNILSLNNCSRIPKAPQVTVIGKGRIEGHQGLGEMDLQHLDHLSFHEKPLSAEAVREGFTRPYRWHMDAPLYENLPGIATVLHAVQVPSLPDQRLAFEDDEQQELEIAAGATAC